MGMLSAAVVWLWGWIWKDGSSGSRETHLLIAMVLCWSTASHLAWSGPLEGAMAEAGLPSRVLHGDALQDLLPLEPLWDVLAPALALSVGSQLGVFGVQLTLGLTFAQPLLLLLFPGFLALLEECNERLLAWHLGGLFGQPMLVAQVAVARAERHAGRGCVKAFGLLVGAYSLGAVAGAGLRRLAHRLPPFLCKVVLKVLVIKLVMLNIFAVRINGDKLGEHHEHAAHEDEHPTQYYQRQKARQMCSQVKTFLAAELERLLQGFTDCTSHLAARSAALFGLMLIMGPAPLPAVDFFAYTPFRKGFAVFWFDVVGVVSYAVVVPLLNEIWQDKTRCMECLDLFFLPSLALGAAAAMFAMLELTSTLHVTLITGLATASCSAVLGALLSADMSEKAPHLADVGMRLAWGLLCGGAAQFLGSQLGQILFLYYSWLGVSLCSFAALLTARHYTRKTCPKTLAASAPWRVAAMQQPEPLILKVMRLRQPGTAPPLPLQGLDVPKALVPMALQQSLVGEPFTGYLHVLNVSHQTVENVAMRVEIDIGASKFTLLNTGASPTKTLPPGEFVDAIVHHELRDAGTYALACLVTYTCAGEQGHFRRAYRFPALQPFAVSHRVIQIDRQLLVECSIENATQGSIYLTSWQLDCAPGFESRLVTELEKDPITGSALPLLLKPRGCFVLVFSAWPEEDAPDSAAVREQELLGSLAMSWRVPDGPAGRLEGHQIRMKAVQVPSLDLQVVECPSQVKVEVPFTIELEVTNRTAEKLEPKMHFDLRLMGAAKLLSVERHLPKLDPGARHRFPMQLLVTVPGLHGLNGVFVMDDRARLN
ncbi:trappc13 [Symbiodinium microadriaticum]|nr:trappc13 [Symbiodinium microadriaticum]CAE7341992.1 trappc13 [Symbiodinium sp. KB8]